MSKFLYCVLALILGYLLCLTLHPRGDPQIIEVERVDTFTVYEPVEVTNTLIKYVPQKLRVVEHDTVYLESGQPQIVQTRDSAEVLIPITQRLYRGEDYTAYVSGYDPRLDSISIYRHIREPPKPSRLHLSVGVGATYNGRLSPGLFIGVSYSFKEIRL